MILSRTTYIINKYFRAFNMPEKLQQPVISIGHGMRKLHSIILECKIILKGQGTIVLLGVFPPKLIALIVNVLSLPLPPLIAFGGQYHRFHALIIK